MDYELAKQLKDAGFKQTHSEIKIYIQKDKDSEQCMIPTLPELIEACGERFRYLVRHTDFNRIQEERWQAKPNRHKVPKSFKSQRGKTPEIAVARLWLAIHSLDVDK